MDRLPPELLSRIFSFIDLSDKQTLEALRFSCKKFSHVVYEHFIAKVDISSESDYENGNKILRSMIIQSWKWSGLASYVKHLSLRNEPVFECLPDLMLYKAARAAQLQIPGDLYWERTFTSDPKNDASLATLLPMLKSLESLDLEFTLGLPVYLHQLLNRIMRTTLQSGTDPILPKLKSVVLVYSKTTRGPSPFDDRGWGPLMPGIFYLPVVKSIYLRKVYWGLEPLKEENLQNYKNKFEDIDYEDNDDSLVTIEPMRKNSSGVTHIEIRSCLFPIANFSSIARSPKRLLSFVYMRDEPREGHHGPTINFVLRCLRHHQDCLQRLWVEILPKICCNRDLWRGNFELYSFEGFRKLEHLRIGIYHLMDNQGEFLRLPGGLQKATGNCFPQSIIKVHVSASEGRLQQIRKFISSMLSDRENEHIPFLKTIVIEVFDYSEEMMAEITEDLPLCLLAWKLDVNIIVRWETNIWDDGTEDEEWKWGVDSEVEWAPCSDRRHKGPPFKSLELQPNDYTREAGFELASDAVRENKTKTE